MKLVLIFEKYNASLEKKKNKFDEFYNLANLELFDNDRYFYRNNIFSVGDSRGDPNPLQR